MSFSKSTFFCKSVGPGTEFEKPSGVRAAHLVISFELIGISFGSLSMLFVGSLPGQSLVPGGCASQESPEAIIFQG